VDVGNPFEAEGAFRERLKTGTDGPFNKRSLNRAEFFALPFLPQTRLRYAPLKLSSMLADQERQIFSGN
jgi:hypothetical protein